jgi:hypothetical protein
MIQNDTKTCLPPSYTHYHIRQKSAIAYICILYCACVVEHTQVLLAVPTPPPPTAKSLNRGRGVSPPPPGEDGTMGSIHTHTQHSTVCAAGPRTGVGGGGNRMVVLPSDPGSGSGQWCHRPPPPHPSPLSPVLHSAPQRSILLCACTRGQGVFLLCPQITSLGNFFLCWHTLFLENSYIDI